MSIDYDIHYSTYDNDNLHKILDVLLSDGYVCRISTEEKLYIIDAIGTYETSYKGEDGIPHYESDRNETVFMRGWEFEENYCELIKKDEVKDD